MADGGFEAVIREQLARWTAPGAAVGVLRSGERELHAVGMASLETEQPVRPDTLFQIGSISKVFCATLVMTLVDEGKVELDTPVSRYLPELKLADAETRRSLTIRQTLSHTSGIYGDYFEDTGWGEDALAKSIEQVADLRQWTPVGSSWAYCNVGFNLAGRVVEVVLGQPFETAMRERVFEPLSLEHTFFFAHEAIVHPVAVGHTLVEPGKDEHEVARKYPLPRAVNPAGGIISNVDDLLSFAAFHMSDGTLDGKRVLSPESIRIMQETQTTAANWADEWGVGWDIRWFESDGGRLKVIGHGGTTNGFQARLTLVPDRRYAIAMLTNSARGAAFNDRVETWALEHELGLTRPELPKVKVAPASLERFAGQYTQPQAEYSISIDDGGLRVRPESISPLTGKRTTPPAFTMAPVGENQFVITSGDAEGRRIDFFGNGGEADAPRFVRVHGRLAERAS